MRRARFLSSVAYTAAATLCTARLPALAHNRRIAILAEPGGAAASQDDLDRFAAKLGEELIATHRVELLSRARLRAVLAEQGFSNSDYADPSTAAELGKVIGASDILWAKLSVDVSATNGGFVAKASVEASADFELISVSTAVITQTGTADGDDDEDSVSQFNSSIVTRLRHNAVDGCATDLAGQLRL